MSVWKANKENAFNGKQKDSAQREMFAVSDTTRISVEKQLNRLLLLQNRRLKAMGKILGKGKLSKAAVLLERDLEDRAKTIPVELVRTRNVIFGNLPKANIT